MGVELDDDMYQRAMKVLYDRKRRGEKATWSTIFIEGFNAAFPK